MDICEDIGFNNNNLQNKNPSNIDIITHTQLSATHGITLRLNQSGGWEEGGGSSDDQTCTVHTFLSLPVLSTTFSLKTSASYFLGLINLGTLVLDLGILKGTALFEICILKGTLLLETWILKGTLLLEINKSNNSQKYTLLKTSTHKSFEIMFRTLLICLTYSEFIYNHSVPFCSEYLYILI